MGTKPWRWAGPLLPLLVLHFGCSDPGTPTPGSSEPPSPAGESPTSAVTPTLTMTPTAPVTPTVTAGPTPTLTSPPTATPVGPTPSATPVGPTPSSTPVDNDLDDDGFTSLDGDCDDTDPDIYPDASETPYDGVDQDCQNGDLVDVDGDSYIATQAGGNDCDDTSTTIYPGASEFEDDRDNDCDGQIDEALNTTDDDGDGYSEATGDCDDSDPSRAPNKDEIFYDGIDQDCTGADLNDVDGDGYPGGPSGTDCNDSVSAIHPGATDIPYDGIDQNCNGADLVDQDQDGAEGGPDGTDCDDLDPTRSPLLTEVPYDGVDQDCSGADLVDVDQDGQAATQAGGTDCNDADPGIKAGAVEVPYDGVDQDCSGADLIDVDGDTFPALQAGGTDCDDLNQSTYPGAPEFEDDKDNDCNGQIDDGLNTNDDDGDGFTEATGDCNDGDISVYPGATEIPYDGVDQDCSGTDLTDVDGDGFAGGTGPDCNDQNLDINPDEADVPYDGIDQDCSGADLTDVDGDGFVAEEAGGDDCDDSTGLIYPGAVEVPYDAVDQDCSGTDLTDVDGDGFDAAQVGGPDCNDSDLAIHPDATEVCDNVDNNCDSVVDTDATDRSTFYLDADGDTYGDPTQGALVCTPSLVQVANGLDCNDASAISFPGATEICDDLDNNCDSVVDEDVKLSFFADTDGDLYGDANVMVLDCEAPDGYVEDFTDCDDLVESTNPGAAEVCNDVDDNCDDAVDEGVLISFYPDEDGDGFGVTDEEVQLCEAPAGYVETPGDCDDAHASAHPGGSEVCDPENVDEDCNGSADDADPGVDATTKTTWYRDSDGDGYGSATVSSVTCDAPSGYVADGTDCNAANPAIHPGATELAGDSVDQNCDGQELCYQDTDDDGYRPDATSTVTSTDKDCLDASEAVTADPVGDCNDTNAAIKPDASELTGDSVDQNCDGLETCFKDSDNDGYRPDVTSTTASSDADCKDSGEALATEPAGDCNDADPLINPIVAEQAGDSVDQNCDGVEMCYTDADNDGYRPNSTSTTGSSDSDCADANEATAADPTGDCNDGNAAIRPNVSDPTGDGVDQNCDGGETCFKDADDDGYRPDATSTTASSDPDCLDAGEALATDPTGDCNDSNAAIKPGASELTGDSVDQNCDGVETCFKDADDDGYRPDATSTTASSDTDCADVNEAAASDPTGDCNDGNAAIKPSATELAGDSIDQNCDGVEMCYTDADNDGYRPNSTSTTGSSDTDCADVNEATATDPTGDCNDGNAAIKPGATETPGDNIDSDCNSQETCFKDADDDGFRPDSTSTTASGDSDCNDVAEATQSDPTGDCNDGNAAIKPSASEVVGDGTDQNCNGQEICYTDADNDGYAISTQLTSTDTDCTDSGEGTASELTTTDCNDSSSSISPAASEVCNAVDDNCNSTTDDPALVCPGCSGGVCALSTVNDGSTTAGTDLKYQYAPVTAGSGTIKANWSAVTGATGYRISIGTSAGATNVLGVTSIGAVTSYTATGLSLSGAWTGTKYYVNLAAVNGSNVGGTVSSNGVQIAEAVSWDGASTTGLNGGYNVNWPTSGITSFYGAHYFETVTIASSTKVHVQGWGKAQSVGEGIGSTATAVTSPSDGWLSLYANDITINGHISASGRGYGGGGGGLSTCGSGAGPGRGGSSGLGGNGGNSGGGCAAPNEGGGGSGSPFGTSYNYGGQGNLYGGGGGSSGQYGYACAAGNGGSAASCGVPGQAGASGEIGGTGGTPSVSNSRAGDGGVGEFMAGGGGGGGSSSNSSAGGGGGGYGAGGGGGNENAGGGGGGGSGGAPGGSGGGYSAGGAGAGPYPGSGGAAANCPAGSAGHGGYATSAGNGDGSTDRSLRLGSGGGGGGGDTGGQSAGGGGGAGGGALYLYAYNTLSIGSTGKVMANGAGGGGAGRDDNSCRVGGVGGRGAGGGILLEGRAISLSSNATSVISARGADGATANGGTIKLFYTTFTGSKPGSSNAGRVYDAGAGSFVP